MNRGYESELEYELESELETEFEEEYEGEEFLGTIARGIGSLIGGGQGEGEFEEELEWEGEEEFEGEYEGEEFFGRIARGIGGFVRRAAPILKRVARVAAPIVGTAVGGPLGGMIGRVASQALREGEFEDEFEGESEAELEAAVAPMTRQQALAEMMASVASQAQTEAEAEAMTGAAVAASLSVRDQAELRRVLPHIVRGASVLTRILRRQRLTRPAVRAVPAIVRRTATVLTRRAAAGQPVTRATTARVMANQTQRVLGRPATCARALQRNAQAARTATGASRPATRRPAR